jgi:hypothetical protein
MVTFFLLFCWVEIGEEISVVTEVKPSKFMYSMISDIMIVTYWWNSIDREHCSTQRITCPIAYTNP